MRKRASFAIGLAVALSSISIVCAQETQEISLPLVAEYGEDIQLADTLESTSVWQAHGYQYASYLMGLDGTALTDAKYGSMMGEYGYVVTAEAEGDVNTSGLLDQSGNEVIPFQYGDVEVLSTRWAIGLVLEEATAEHYDYSSWSGNSYWLIKQADIYYLPNASCIASLDRSSYEDAKVYDDRIKILNRKEQTVNVYDSQFNPIATDLNSSVLYDDDYFGYTVFADSNNKKGLKDLDGNVVLEPTVYRTLVRGRQHGYYEAIEHDRYVLLNEDGTVAFPIEYDRIKPYMISRADSDDEYAYFAYGYAAFVNDDTFKYADISGTITGDYSYPDRSITNYGVSALIQDYTSDTYTLLAADGVETKLEGYKYVFSIENSDGMYYLVKQDGEGYDIWNGVIDWHGNVVIPCEYEKIIASGDGKYVAVSETYDRGPYKVYELLYPDRDTTDANQAPAESTALVQAESVPESVLESQTTTESQNAPEELTSEPQSGESQDGFISF